METLYRVNKIETGNPKEVYKGHDESAARCLALKEDGTYMMSIFSEEDSGSIRVRTLLFQTGAAIKAAQNEYHIPKEDLEVLLEIARDEE